MAGCSSPKPEEPPVVSSQPKEPVKFTSKDVEDVERVYRDYDKVLRTGTKEARVKATLDLMPTDAELEAAFPKHAEPAKSFHKQLRAAIPQEFGRGAKDDRSELVRVVIDDARATWAKNKAAEQRLLAALAPDIVVVEGHAERKGVKHGIPTFIKVNGRWVMLVETYDLISALKLAGEPK